MKAVVLLCKAIGNRAWSSSYQVALLVCSFPQKKRVLPETQTLKLYLTGDGVHSESMRRAWSTAYAAQLPFRPPFRWPIQDRVLPMGTWFDGLLTGVLEHRIDNFTSWLQGPPHNDILYRKDIARRFTWTRATISSKSLTSTVMTAYRVGAVFVLATVMVSFLALIDV